MAVVEPKIMAINPDTSHRGLFFQVTEGALYILYRKLTYFDTGLF